MLERREVLSTFTVTSLADRGTGTGRQGDLRYAINMANTNPDLSNQIIFQAGLSGTITLTQGPLVINKSLRISGPGEDLLTISGDHQSGVVNITADPRAQVVKLSGLTIADGTGITVNGRSAGGGIYNDHAALTVSHCTISGNTVGANGSGGGIENLTGSLTLDATTIAQNASGGDGGGIRSESGMVTIRASLIADNQAGAGANGGGLSLDGPAAITDTTFSGNSAGGQGGGIFINVPLQTTTLVTLSQCVLEGNRGVGGALMNLDAAVVIANSTVSGNTATVFGVAGGLENALSSARMSITDSVIADNTGTGVVNIGQMTVSGSTISGNSSDSPGGGLAANYGDTNVVNCTISGNTSAQYGGGISLFGTASVELTSVTITGNTANGGTLLQHGGGGLASYPTIAQGGRAVLRNTLIAGNSTATVGPDVVGMVISLGFNLVGETDDSSGWIALDHTGDSANPLDPMLGPLQDNGGPTPTHALLAGSPAIETGDPTLFGSVDQRGTNRFHSGVNAAVDIGAFDAAVRRGFRLEAPANVVAGEPFVLTVVVLDPAGNVASTFTGTIHFSSSDLDAVLPDDYTFAPRDAGVATVSVTLQTQGNQQLQVNDVDVPGIRASATVNVDAASGMPARAARWADLFFGEADPVGFELASLSPDRKGRRWIWLD